MSKKNRPTGLTYKAQKKESVGCVSLRCCRGCACLRRKPVSHKEYNGLMFCTTVGKYLSVEQVSYGYCIWEEAVKYRKLIQDMELAGIDILLRPTTPYPKILHNCKISPYEINKRRKVAKLYDKKSYL